MAELVFILDRSGSIRDWKKKIEADYKKRGGKK